MAIILTIKTLAGQEPGKPLSKMPRPGGSDFRKIKPVPHFCHTKTPQK